MDKIVVAAWLQLMAEFILSGDPAQSALFLFCLGFILHKDSILLVQIGPQLLAKCWNDHPLQNMTCTSVLSRYIFVPDKLLKLEKCADLCYFLYIFQTTTDCLKLYQVVIRIWVK